MHVQQCKLYEKCMTLDEELSRKSQLFSKEYETNLEKENVY